PLADGAHEFTVTATDVAGRSDSASVRFAIDTTGPVVTFTKHPKAMVKTRKKKTKVAFAFASSEPNSTFLCQVDKAAPKACAPSSSWSFKLGKHVVSVRALDTLGNAGAPIESKFKVVKARPKKHHKGDAKKS